MSAIESKQHDTARVLRSYLKLSGTVIDLSAASTINLFIKNVDTGEVVSRTASAYGDPTTGEVRYQPVADDVAEPGVFLIEWEIIFNDGRRVSGPDGREGGVAYDTWTILKDLG